MLFALAAYALNYNEMLTQSITMRKFMKYFCIVLTITVSSVANYASIIKVHSHWRFCKVKAKGFYCFAHPLASVRGLNH